MKIVLVLASLLASFCITGLGQSCSEKAQEVRPQLSAEAEMEYSRNLEIAARNAVSDPSADNLIWYARRKGYLGRYKDAIDALTISLEKFPGDARIYRHRGHRLITLRCFEDAVQDLEKAAAMTKGKPDEIEPDGMPNAKNIPTSTLQSNIWYHLGLAYYLKGDLKRALKAYEKCAKVSKNNDMRVATAHWRNMTMRRMGKKVAAARLLDQFKGNIEVIENDDYLTLIRLYRGERNAEDLSKILGREAKTLGSASLGYGLGNWYFYIGETEKGLDIFRKIVAGDQWASFGYIAAEAELARQPRK
ncbi:MAG: tetratricopeptide repeat protein [Pyrinomonadaceae bacterium]|nr:tetratricopeptide repeat protein [Pyrinomonadaceae bacterium]